MKKNKNSDNIKRQNVKIIIGAVCGLVFIAVFFLLVMQSGPVLLLRPQPGALWHDIITKAESLKPQLFLPTTPNGTPHHSFTKKIAPFIDYPLFKYAQYYKKQKGKFPLLAVAGWDVIWKDTQRKKENPPSGAPDVQVSFDFNGQIIGFITQRESAPTPQPLTITEDDALIEAKSLLESLNIHSKSMIITDKEFSKTETLAKYSFTLKNPTPPYPHLTENYHFVMMGNRIVQFKKETTVNLEELDTRNKNDMTSTDILVILIFWVTSIILALIVFVKKLRRDQLEFKWAIRLGLVVAGIAAVLLLLMAYPSLLEGILSGTLVGGLLFICILILFSVSEALSREVWPEKFAVLDLIFQGRGGVRETGKGILRAYFLMGSTLLLIGGFVLCTAALNTGYLFFESDLLAIFLDFHNTVGPIFQILSVPVLAGCLFLIFWPTFLKKIVDKHPRTRILILAVIFAPVMGIVLFFEPPWLKLLLAFPIALLWAYAVFKWDHFTVLLSFLGTFFGLDLTLILVMPNRLFSLAGILSIIFALLIFFLGLFLLSRAKSARDYETYVPEYVNRIAEKERFLKELEIARGVQMRFLPQKVPQSPGLEIVSLCQPAMEVGGDYFDFVQIDSRYMTVLIGDVSGKGVSAAFYMTMVKGIIKTLSKKTLIPSILLAEANEIFYENAPRGVFVTIIYGIFDLVEKTLTVASAGHNPLIVWHHNTGATELINPQGLALGLVKNERYKSIIAEKGIPIHEKDVFVFYTDGVSEAMNLEEDIFGEERLLEIIKANAHLSPQQLQEKIVNGVAQFTGKAPQHDDFTMVVVKVRPQAE